MKKNPYSKIDIVRGDITKLDVDAIVNAANTTLLGGGGVDGAIHRAAGPELLAECRTLGGCKPGEAKLTRGYRLPARFIIHTVGPVWRGGTGDEPETLANCYRNSLQLAVENEIKTIAFAAISCGAYGYPIPDAAQVALKTGRDFLATDDRIDKVTIVLWSEDIYEAYRQLL
jgi:O-acetyl-ADP-ribose deacetylase (regulator of RNase III)